jgi:hypothetical protein
VGTDTKKKLAFVCLLLFLLATGVTAFHTHDGEFQHDDCPICVTAFAVSTACLSFFVFVVYILAFALETISEPTSYDFFIHALPLARAPPA